MKSGAERRFRERASDVFIQISVAERVLRPLEKFSFPINDFADCGDIIYFLVVTAIAA